MFASPKNISTLGATSNPRTDRAIPQLIDKDATIRWQVLRDLVEAPQRMVEREQ
jgi:hypothetical protein